MSTDNAAAGMPKNMDPKEVLWGRQGLGASFYGSELIAEAISGVLKTAERDRLRGFTNFPAAFQKHNDRMRSWKIGEGNSVLAVLEAVDIFNANSNTFHGVGSYGEEFGLTARNPEALTPPPLKDIQSWVTRAEWNEITRKNDRFRVGDHRRMPDQQISHIRNKCLFINRAGNLFIVRVHWKAQCLQPSLYCSLIFNPFSLDLAATHALDRDGIFDFCQFEGAEAGTALLHGIKLMLQSSNYQVRQDLEKNDKAEAMAQSLLERIRV